MLERHFTYTWNSKATNAPLTLSATVKTEDNSLSPTLALSLDHRGITWETSLSGIGPVLGGEIPEWTALPLYASTEDNNLACLKVHTPRDVILAIQRELNAAEADHLTHMMTTAQIHYELHPENLLDIDSGFFDQLIERLIRARIKLLAADCMAADSKQLDTVMLVALDQSLLYKLKDQMDDLFFDRAYSNYTPFPIDPTWTQETRDYRNKLLAEGKAPGDAMIPASEVVAAIDYLLAEQFAPRLQEMQDHYDAIADKESRYDHHYTAEEAAAWERNYNNVQNEGGEGYVPHIITQQEAVHAAEVSDICAAMIRRLKRVKRTF